MSTRLCLIEYAIRCWRDEGHEPLDVGSEAVLLALDALRVGVGVTLEDLARNKATRRAWVEAAKLLEHERATRRALALSSPGLRLEDAIRGEPDEVVALEAAITQADERIADARRRGP